MSELERRIRRLEDRAELHDLIVRYFLAVDDDSYDVLADTFAVDATFSAGAFVGGRGRDNVVAFLRNDRLNMGPTIHTPHYSLFEFQGDDRATGTTGAHLELSRAGKTLYGAVRYIDTFVREQGAWRILAREMRTVHVGPWEDVGTSLTSELCVRWPGVAPAASDYPKR
jgi:hypothetical protein